MLINWIHHTKSKFLSVFVYHKSLEPAFEAGFSIQNNLWNLCLLVVNLQQKNVVEKLVSTVGIKAFCVTNIFHGCYRMIMDFYLI